MSRPSREQAPRCDILAVDDTPQNLTAIRAALDSSEYQVVTAQSGEEALRRLLEQEFALVLLDVQMPVMNGFETAKLLRARERTRHLPIIFITAYADDDAQILAAYSLGAVDFLSKPIKLEILRAKVAVFAALERRTREARAQAEQIRAHVAQERERWTAEQRARLEAEALQQRLEEQRVLAAELELLNRRLAENDRQKDEFFAALGHELRNPLAPLVSGLALLEAAGVAGPRAAMQRQVSHLTRLVDDLLDMSRVTRGRIEIRSARVRAGDILDQAVALATPLFIKKGHTLEIERGAADMAVYGDEVRLTQVISNLLTNAARYTDAGGHIRVACEADGNDIRFSVKDNGRGMSAELLPRVFEFFVQARAGGGGLGIGLALVKQIVEMHHGRVEARSEGEGRGSEVCVWLPPSPREVPGAVRVDPVLPESKTRRALSIVLIEDNDDVRLLLRELLVAWGHRVSDAANGRSGLELISHTRPDVAFVDIGLPDLDGYELGRQICNLLGAQKPMLVALSGFAQDKDRERALLAGFDHHLNKPASPGDLERVLRDAEGAPASEARADRAGGAEG